MLLQARQIERKLIRSEMDFWGVFEYIWGNPAMVLHMFKLRFLTPVEN